MKYQQQILVQAPVQQLDEIVPWIESNMKWGQQAGFKFVALMGVYVLAIKLFS